MVGRTLSAEVAIVKILNDVKKWNDIQKM